MSFNIGRQAEPRLAVGAIFKNEAPYVLEWVALHRAIGFSRFFIADNASDDGTTELLAGLARIGVVDHIPFPGQPDKPPQLPAYAEILRAYGDQVDWIAFIDADEFIVPLDGSASIVPVLEGMPRNVGAVAVNWALYGSSYRSTPSSGLVLERFHRRGKDDLTVNHHYKTMLRTAAYKALHGNPHIFKIHSGFRYAHVDGSPVEHHPKKGPGLSSTIQWPPFRINHYVVKSRAEFDRKKAPRGRATTMTARREPNFFVGHDRNELEDPVPGHLIEATKAGMEDLRTRLRGIGLDESIVMADASIAGLEPASQPPLAEGIGAVDKLSIVDGMLILQGWALTPDRTRPDGFSVRIREHLPKIVDLTWHRRADVVRGYDGAEQDSGFRLVVSLAELPEETLKQPVLRVVVKSRQSKLRLVGKLALNPALGKGSAPDSTA